MRYIFLVAWREYIENAKTKGFWIGICLLPVLLFFSMQIPALLEKKGTPTRQFVLIDQSGQFDKTVEEALEKLHQRRVLQALIEYASKYTEAPGRPGNSPGQSAPARRDASPAGFADARPENVERFIREGGQEMFLRELRPRLPPGAPEFKEPRRLFERVPLPAGIRDSADLSSMAQELKPYLRGEKKIALEGRTSGLFAAVLIPPDVEQRIVRPGAPPRAAPVAGAGIEYWSVNLADESLREAIQQAVNAEIRRREYVTRGMDLALVRQIEATQVPFASLNPKKEEGQEQVSRADVLRQWAPVAFVYLLWVAIFSIMQMLLNNVIEEKSNRIIEVLLSSVTPGELMMGKLAGIAAVGLTMVGAWVLALVGLVAWKAGGQSEVARQMYTVIRSSPLLPAFIVYFFLGYLMYAALILALGSVCNTLKEAQNYMATILMIMMVPLLTMMFIPKDPNGTLATLLSWIPLYTPFIMMNRAAADPPLFDLVGTMILLVLFTALALWAAVRIFRVGILRTGQPPKLVEMARWLWMRR